MNRTIIAMASLSTLAGFAGPANHASADPLPGEILKFQQLPLNGPNMAVPPVGAPYPGHDELSTAYQIQGTAALQGTYMADDFADKFDTPVLHIRFWGSYLNPPAVPHVQQFLVAFESDIPASIDPLTGALIPSRPGSVLSTQIVSAGLLAPGSGTFEEKAVPTAVNATEPLYQYNAELSRPFAEKADTVYWLKIVALTNNPDLKWGWHDRDYFLPDPYASTSPAVTPGERNIGPAGTPIFHFQDDAVSGRINIQLTPAGGTPTIQQFDFLPQNYIDGVDGPQGIGQYSKDLAFELYTTVPEPASIGLLGLAGMTMLSRRRRR